jgi:hypothetical protein
MKLIADLHIHNSFFQWIQLVIKKVGKKRCSYTIRIKSQQLLEVYLI